MNNELAHHGIKGQKWGVRRTPTQLGHRPSKKEAKKKGTQKSVKDMTDEELRAAINRVKLERDYNDMVVGSKTSLDRGKKFVARVLEKSGENIATQLTTYGLGEFVNLLAGEKIVNPKKGQKDK